MNQQIGTQIRNTEYENFNCFLVADVNCVHLAEVKTFLILFDVTLSCRLFPVVFEYKT